MKVVIVGNGAAGTTAAIKIRNLNKEVEVYIISNEKYPYYARPRLHEIIEGKLEPLDIQVFKNEWYMQNNIDLILNENAQEIDSKNKVIFTDKSEYKFDKLLLATGSEPFIPKSLMPKSDNIYTLRSMNDALTLKNAVINKKEIIIVGGGLLGLEIASSFLQGGRIVKVIEMNSDLLKDQLTPTKSDNLKSKLESRGIEFYLGEICEEITLEDNMLIVKTVSGKKLKGQMILISAGTRPRINIANNAYLNIKRGIIVNNFLQTNSADIYAAGDCTEHNGRVYGYVKSAIEQGNFAGENIILGNIKEYKGTNIDVKLKIKDIDLSNL